jgi:chromosome transmission fidelity protein 8
MPSIPIYAPSGASETASIPSPLPQLLQTPSGLALVELQGTINVPAISEEGNGQEANEDASFTRGISTPVGKLLFPAYSPSNPKEDTAWMKHVYLYVGKHQRMTGEIKKLPKPMGIMRKRTKASDEDPDELEIVEIVNHKIVFLQRPEPVGDF